MLASSGATTHVLLVKTEREDDPYIKVRQPLPGIHKDWLQPLW